MKVVHMAACMLVWIGGINWGLVGLLDVNLVSDLLGQWPVVEKLVYILVGASAVYEFATHQGNCKVCGSK